MIWWNSLFLDDDGDIANKLGQNWSPMGLVCGGNHVVIGLSKQESIYFGSEGNENCLFRTCVLYYLI